MLRLRNQRTIGRRAFLKTSAGVVASGALPSRIAAQTKKHTVTIWCHFAGTNYEIFQRYVAAFNQATPDVEVKAVSYGPS